MADQCFCYNRDRQRCDLDGGHEGVHQYTVVWTSDESWSPELGIPILPAVTSGISLAEPMPVIPPVGAGGDGGPIDKCFICGCREAAHPEDGTGCSRHECKKFLPT